jgi:Mrp family chromosome partitioning ATPase
MTHKPKLVAVTGCSHGAGASTLAGGIAAALSETGDGKVLLVDMNGQPEVHPFFDGQPASSLSAALQPAKPIAPAADNLYLATVSSPGGKQVPLGLKKFYDLMPNLKASDFDYIIFDMPPLGPTSPTLMVASCMDKVLMVVEAEKTNRDAVKRGYEEMLSVRANVSVVFNKAHSYGPKWVENDNHV